MHANVVLAARRTEVLNEVAGQVTAAGGTALVVTVDVARPEDLRRLAEETVRRFGRIDVWINNAGVGAIGEFDKIPMEDHARVVDVNLKGVIYGSHVALRQFRQQGHGVLMNIGSVESEVPQAYHASYSSTKAAVLAPGRALREELRLAGQDRIAVTTVLPRAADTPFFEHASNYSGHAPRMPLMDDPAKVVDIIVRASVYPREEVPAGWKARSAYWGHRIAPDITERISAGVARKGAVRTGQPGPKQQQRHPPADARRNRSRRRRAGTHGARGCGTQGGAVGWGPANNVSAVHFLTPPSAATSPPAPRAPAHPASRRCATRDSSS
ncbi:SDR family oxidoreductase [Massilia sp. Se16.2.3]|uniref:SDR family NAD(P)-dependent oxidoreductase n=1 Tax=Massilia sp. Se16.2.3 TaxID=2709303 RepID=UPI00191F9695|nr:SDR family NAD(P)-dependent oxidoreductase [Massilia sp. Se16.2.3]